MTTPVYQSLFDELEDEIAEMKKLQRETIEAKTMYNKTLDGADAIDDEDIDAAWEGYVLTEGDYIEAKEYIEECLTDAYSAQINMATRRAGKLHFWDMVQKA